MNAPLQGIARTRIGRIHDPAVGLHVAIFMPHNQIIGDAHLRLVSFQGQEAMGEPFEFNLELHGNTAPQDGDPIHFGFPYPASASGQDAGFRSVLGRSITIGLCTAGAIEESGEIFAKAIQGQAVEHMVLFNGLISRFSMEQPGVYRLTMQPRLWTLSLANAYRHFSEKNIRETVAAVLNQHGVEHVFIGGVDRSTDISLTRRQDWLQAGESDLEFVQRLLGKAHLFYFFEHNGTSHRMVITEGDTAYGQVNLDGRPLNYTWTGTDELGMDEENRIVQYAFQESLTASHVVGTYLRQKAEWEVPAIADYDVHGATESSGPLPFHQYKVYQYGMSDGEAAQLARNSFHALAASRSQFSGGSRCPRMSPGRLFKVSGAEMARSNPMPVRPTLEGQEYVLTQVKHQANLDGGYQNEFSAVPRAPVARFSLQDTQQGGVLAKVIPGQPDDWRYYPRSVFDPLTKPESDSQASANPVLNAQGVRVQLATGEQFWARLSSSMASAPEVGATVLVARASDESELPEIANLISAAGSMVVKPTGWTAHTSVGNNYSTSWGDSKGVHGGSKTPDAILGNAKSLVDSKYATGQFKDCNYNQGAGYSYSTSEKGRSGILSESESYGNTYSKNYADETKSWSDTGYSYNNSLLGDSDAISVQTGTATSNNTSNIVISSNTTTQSTSTSQTGMQNDASAIGMQNTASAIGLQNSASAVGLQNSINLSGVTNGLSLGGLQNSLSLQGETNSLNLTGTGNDLSLTGSRNSLGLTGVQNGLNLTGAANSLNLTGSQNSLNLTGNQTSLNLTGENTSVNLTGSSMDLSVRGAATSISVVAGPTNTINVNTMGPVIDIDLDGALVLHMDPAVIRLDIPALQIIIDEGLEIHL